MSDSVRLYRELINHVLVENKVERLHFKWGNSFGRKYSMIEVLPYHKGIIVHDSDLGIKFNALLLDFTLDYARFLDMLESDLFSYHHHDVTRHFTFEFRK